MKIYRGFVALAIAGFFLLGGTGSKAESLPEALNQMLQTHPDIRAAAYKRLALDQEVWQTLAGYYPTVDVLTGYGFDDKYEPDNTYGNPKMYGLSVNFNIFKGFETENELKRQIARVRSAIFRLQGISEVTALRGANVYLNVLRHRALHDLSRENLEIHQRIFDQIKLRSESGVDRKADLDHVKGRLALAQSNMVVTEVNTIDAETNFQAVIGHLPGKLIEPESVQAAIPTSMEEAQLLAVDNLPALKAIASDVEAREAQNMVAKSPLFPRVDIAFDRTWEDEVNSDPDWNEEFSGMLTVRFNIFNGYKDTARILETAHLVSEAREIRNNTQRQTIESIRLSWMASKVVQDKILHLEEYVESSAATAEAYTKQWNIGKRTMLDVLDIEAELINAKIDLINARYDGLYAQYRILGGMGKLVHAMGLQWPAESHKEIFKGYTPQQGDVL